MRSDALRMAVLGCGVAALASFTVSCDSSDPAQLDSQTLTINVAAGGANAVAFLVWDMIVDNDVDFVPDDGQTYRWCVDTPTQDQVPATVPWPFSAKVDIIRAGTTVRETITTPAALDPALNVANYDTVNQRSTNQTMAPIIEDGSRFVFTNPRRMPSLSQTVAFSTVNPLAQIRGNRIGTTCPGGSVTANTRCGLCTAVNNGLPRLDGIDVGGAVACRGTKAVDCGMPFAVTLNKGDTLIFEARLADVAPFGVGLRNLLTRDPTSLSTGVQADGQVISVRGTSSGKFISFSYTSN